MSDLRPPAILIVDDEAPLREMLRRTMERGHARCRVAGDGASALAAAREERFDLVLLDIRLPDTSGLEVLRRLRALPQPPEVVLMSGHADVATAIQGFRDGACDLVQKPFTLARLSEALEVAEARRALAERARTRGLLGAVAAAAGEAEAGPGAGAGPEGAAGGPEGAASTESTAFVAVSPAMREVVSIVERVAPTEATVLIEGETGTGKEVVARTIHARSPRRAGPFIAVNCGAIPDTLIEAELFGHVPGAFTGATGRNLGLVRAASGGTLFLDEVGELTPAAQVKLLRVLQERVVVPVGSAVETPVDVRVVAATNRSLDADAQTGRFRRDLLFRLDIVRIQLPSLRQRPEDLTALADHLLARIARRYGRPALAIETEAVDALRLYAFPGNVRELENILERAVALGASGSLGFEDLPPHVLALPFSLSSAAPPGAAPGAATTTDSSKPAADEAPAPALPPSTTSLAGIPTLEQAEKTLIAAALEASGGNRRAAARALGVSSKTITRKARRYGL